MPAYSLKTKIIIAVAIFTLVVAVFTVIVYQRSMSRDLKSVVAAKALATGMEKYFDKFNTYPQTGKIRLAEVNYLTENGINEQGDYLYFVRDFDWHDKATLSANGENYIIEFELKNSWPTWGIQSSGGGICRLGNNLAMSCRNQD